MPSYSYICAEHGKFTAQRPMAEFAGPCACPQCGADCSRQLSLAMKGSGAAEQSMPKAAAPNRPHTAGCSCCSANRQRSPAAAAAVTAASRSGAPSGGLFSGI